MSLAYYHDILRNLGQTTPMETYDVTLHIFTFEIKDFFFYHKYGRAFAIRELYE